MRRYLTDPRILVASLAVLIGSSAAEAGIFRRAYCNYPVYDQAAPATAAAPAPAPAVNPAPAPAVSPAPRTAYMPVTQPSPCPIAAPVYCPPVQYYDTWGASNMPRSSWDLGGTWPPY